jgi:hypothetical protein
VGDGLLVEEIHGGHQSIFEFLFGGDADVAQHRAGELGEEALDKVEPRTVLRREGEFEAVGRLACEPSSGLLGNMRRMIVEDQLDRRIGRIGGIDEL